MGEEEKEKGFNPTFENGGYWVGQRKATDEYFKNNKITMLLNRIDSAARIGIKT